jgi:nucleoid-associated protein YgaU
MPHSEAEDSRWGCQLINLDSLVAPSGPVYNVVNEKQEFLKRRSASVISEREKLEFESLPEFVREPRPSARDAYAPKANPKPVEKTTSVSSVSDAIEDLLPKSAELETLWPGVNHDILHAPTKSPSFYLCIGFLAGAVVSLAVVGGIAAIQHLTVASSPTKKEVVVAHGGTASGGAQNGATVTTVVPANGDPEVIIPLNPTYEVGNGDTLAAIALKNYKRATPRLLDEICRANGMRNANVLSLGQKLSLPEYRPQRQIATGGSSVQQ